MAYQKQIINNTIVVIVVMLCLGIVIWGLDAGLSALVNLVLKSA
ncbi:MAG: preprotein translocase subunit SecE [Oscillospiraceae bacterium]